MKKKKIFIICLLLVVLLLPLVWYNLPYYFRVIYYRNNCERVFDSFIEDGEFDITRKGYTETYDFNNEYVIPFVMEWHVTDDGNADIPKDVISSEYTTYNIIIKAEILIGDKMIYSKSGDKKIPLSYVPRKNLRYFILLRCGYPLRCRFTSDAKLKLTVIDTDPRLEGIRGKLVVKPEITF